MVSLIVAAIWINYWRSPSGDRAREEWAVGCPPGARRGLRRLWPWCEEAQKAICDKVKNQDSEYAPLCSKTASPVSTACTAELTSRPAKVSGTSYLSVCAPSRRTMSGKLGNSNKDHGKGLLTTTPKCGSGLAKAAAAVTESDLRDMAT